MGARDTDVWLQNLSILEALHRLPDQAALTPDEAAIFLRVSVTTLERMRKKGSGPVYLQGGNKESKGTNQKTTYIKVDLIDYQNGLKVTNSLSAAIRRGQAFIPFEDPTPKYSLYDLTTKRPFYISNCEILGCVIETRFETILSRLGKFEIVWLNPIHASTIKWSDEEARNDYTSALRDALQHALSVL